MDKVKWLHQIYPELLSNTKLPLIVSQAQCLQQHFHNEEINKAEWELGRQSAIINEYDSVECVLRYCPHKNISRMFE